MASLNEPLQGGPYPGPDDPPNVPNDMRLIVEWAASRSVMRFPSTSDRDTLLSSPVEGQLCTTGAGTGLQLWLFQAGVWREYTRSIDTGWQNNPFASVESGFSGANVQWRVVNHAVHFIGNLDIPSMEASTIWSDVGYLKSDLIPANPPSGSGYFIVSAGFGMYAQIGITYDSGRIRYRRGDQSSVHNSNPGTCYMDNISYSML